MLAVLALAWLLWRRDIIPAWLLREPHLALVLAGLAWWLFLWPSIVGWIIIALTLLCLLRPRRPAISLATNRSQTSMRGGSAVILRPR